MSFHHKNNHRWIVTLNHTQARIYQGFEKEAGYQLVTIHDFSKGHHKVPHGKEASTKDSQKRFIHSLANDLLKASSTGKFQSLVLVAPHQVLGLLRSELAPVVKQ
ncbi:host attachment protein, partial [bacterium]|nr:host attachment protein [bacterium]